MPISSSIIIGFLRLSLLVLILFYVNKKWINPLSTNTFLDFIVFQWFKYGSVTGMVLFVTVQLNIYDLLNCLLLLSLIITIETIGFLNIRNPITYFEIKFKELVHHLIHRIELHKSGKPWINSKQPQKINLRKVISVLTVPVLASSTFFVIFYFIKYDLFTLSNGWISDLQKITNLDSQQWFSTDMNTPSSLSYSSFYAKITDVSPETALQSIGIVEAVLLTIILFWVIKKITFSNYFAPFIAAFTFALIYVLTPININFILENKPTYLALTFALPAMVFSLKTTLLKVNRYLLFCLFLLVFLVVAIIDLFTFFILIPPFLIIAILFNWYKYSSRFWFVILSYLFSSAIILTFYSIICDYFKTDYNLFLHTNLLSTSTYIYAPQLLIPMSKLVSLYLISALFGLVLVSKFIVINKENWKASFVFLLYFIVLLSAGLLKNSWIDSDLISQSFPVFIPLLIGINTALVIRSMKSLILKLKGFKMYFISLFLLLFIGFAYYFQKPTLDKFEKSEQISMEIVKAYDQIWDTFFPFSYAVVNINETQLFSKNKHYFMSYSFFMKEYQIQDSIYFSHHKDSRFFTKNPESVIPKSVLLFIYKNKSPDETIYSRQQLLNQLFSLERKGRGVSLFYSCDEFDVYELINEPKSSKVIDLIF